LVEVEEGKKKSINFPLFLLSFGLRILQFLKVKGNTKKEEGKATSNRE
jgi:hypothetical protein